MKRKAYRLNISVSELKRLKSAGDGQERTSPLPHGDIIVSHESYEAVSQQDAPSGAQEAALQEAAWRLSLILCGALWDKCLSFWY